VSGVVTCALGQLTMGQSVTVSIVSRPTGPRPIVACPAGEISNTAVVSAAELDPNPDNNTATEVTTVLGLTVIDVTLTGCNPCSVGDTFSAQISVDNRSARAVEMKLGQLQPDGSMSSIGDPHREVPGGSTFVQQFMETIPAGRSPGTWHICGRLLGVQLGDTQAVSCQPFTIN